MLLQQRSGDKTGRTACLSEPVRAVGDEMFEDRMRGSSVSSSAATHIVEARLRIMRPVSTLSSVTV